MTIYIVRHGNYSNPDNIYPFLLPVELSEEGIGQITRVGEWLKTQAKSELPIYTSPVLRCIQTADILAKTTNSVVTGDDRLIESACPNLQGTVKPESEQEALLKECNDPSTEPGEDVQKRMIEIFDEKVREGKDCILVSHGDPITSLYYHLMKMPLVPCLFDDEHFDVYIKRGEIVKVEIESTLPYKVSRYMV